MRAPRGASQHVALAALISAAALTILDVSKVGVSVPAIQASLGADAVAVQLMTVGYTIAYAVLLVPSGRLGDIVSRKTMFAIGLSLFIFASLLCAVAATAEFFVTARIAQGAAAGVLMPQVVGLIQTMYKPQARTRPLAALAVAIAITSAIGPVVAGVVLTLDTSVDGWRWLFWLNVGVGAIVLPIALLLAPNPATRRRAGFDWIGAVLLSAALTLLVFPVASIDPSAGIALWMIPAFLLGASTLATFLLFERSRGRHGREPLLDPLLFRLAHFSPGLLIGAASYAAGTGGSLALTLYLQEALDLNPLATALLLVPSAAAVTVSATIAGRMKHDRVFRLISPGLAICAATYVTIAIATSVAPTAAIPLVVAAMLFVNGLGKGMVAAPNQARILESVPEHRASTAGSTIQLSQRVGSALGISGCLLLYYSIPAYDLNESIRFGGVEAASLLAAGFLLFGFLVSLREGGNAGLSRGSSPE